MKIVNFLVIMLVHPLVTTILVVTIVTVLTVLLVLFPCVNAKTSCEQRHQDAGPRSASSLVNSSGHYTSHIFNIHRQYLKH